jgi:LmbE family N-acetylglucosaminyl deacetylase
LNKKVVVFTPHPDDETLGCGGTIAKKISQDFDVCIVLLTDGRYAYSNVLNMRTNPTPEELGQIRREEFIKATAILGVPESNLTYLDFEDGTLCKQEQEVESRVVTILKECSPSEVYFTFGRDCHSDHQALSRIVSRGIRELGLECAAYQYSILHTYGRIGPFLEGSIATVKRNRIKVNISEFLDLKEKAIREYKSEISGVLGKHLCDVTPIGKDIRHFLKTHETFYVHR